MSIFQKLLKPALFNLDAETAHGVSIKALKTGLVPFCKTSTDERLVQNVAGLKFANPLGLAAGYDKNAEVPDAILQLGFAFSEVGTITPRPQSGNPRPRVFRLQKDEGVINRLGFNNEGHDAAKKRLASRAYKKGIVGINIGANKDSEDFIVDYVKGIESFAHLASYFTINISSPNTPGLRNLQAADILTQLLKRVFEALEKLKLQSPPPVFLKLAPDLEAKDVKSIAKVVNGSKLAGLMVSNTTLARDGLIDTKHANEAGGLSGKPIFERSTIMLARFAKLINKDIALIGIGGIDSTETAWQKMEAGATLLQLYSSMVYKGPKLPSEVVSGLLVKMEAEGVNHISDIIGRKTNEWAAKKLPNE